jgi:RNA polymerase sigma-70 factor (ECF subfamily)
VDAGEAYRRFGTAVHAYLRGQHVPDPDDLLGEVFYQVARSIETFEGDLDALRRWVFTIARNRVIDDRRRRARRARTARNLHDAPLIIEVDDPHDDLVAALARLTEEQREVVGLRFIADLPIEDVARLTDRTVGAVKSMQHRALEQLARHLRDTPQGGSDA